MSLARPRAGSRPRIVHLSRAITLLVVFTSIGTLFLRPTTWWAYLADACLRAYVMFIGTVMAHEATHGHLGRTRRANAWWGRLALLPVMVTYTKFRRTHLLHHQHTNEPDNDPDYFLATTREWEIPLRAVAMPHNWLLWLRRKGRLRADDLRDHLLNGFAIVAVYALVLSFVGWWRVASGVLPATVLVSLLLWYPFAVKTHEGYSTGSPQSRSHNYYGSLMYWFSCGLSMHRVHHMNPGLAWLELRPFVAPAAGPWWRRLLPQRDIQRDPVGAEVTPQADASPAPPPMQGQPVVSGYVTVRE